MALEGFIFLMVLAWISISIIIAFHAEGHGKTKLWGVAILFTGTFGLVFYAISLASD